LIAAHRLEVVACVLDEQLRDFDIIFTREKSKKSTPFADMGVVGTIEDRSDPPDRTPCPGGDKPKDFTILLLKQAVWF
jgi:hypothetical protein